MHDQDSFFTLSAGGQVGLVVLSLALAGAVLLAACFLFGATGRLGPAVALAARCAVALALFWVFVWLSPQVYYLYYQAVFEGLPRQVVVGAPPGPREVVVLLCFVSESTLADHGRGVLGWGLIVHAVLYRRLDALLRHEKE